MCVVSMVTDWGKDKWPTPPDPQPWSTYPYGAWTGPTREEWEEFKDLVARALEYDQRNNEPNCIDPKKAEWLKKMSDVYDQAHDKAVQEAIESLK